MREAFRTFSDLVASTNESMILKLQAKGLLRTDLDVAAVGLCLRALDYGWVLDDINPQSHVDFDAWLELVRVLAVTLATSPTYLDVASSD